MKVTKIKLLFVLFVGLTILGSLSPLESFANQVIKTIPIESRPVRALVSPDGNWAYVSVWSGSNLYIIDTSTDTVSQVVNLGFTLTDRMAFSPDGSKLYVGGYHNNRVAVFNTSTKTIDSYIDASNWVNQLSITSDGTELYLTVSSGWTEVYDTGTGLLTATFPEYFNSRTVFTPDGAKAYVSTDPGTTVSIIDPVSKLITGSISVPVGYRVSEININPDGGRLYVAIHASGTDATLMVIDTSSDTILDVIPLGTDYFAFDVDALPDGSSVYLPATGAGSGSEPGGGNFVSIVNVDTHDISTVEVGYRPFKLSVTPDGSKVYVANNGSANVSVIETRPTLSCEGFEPPMDNGPVTVKKNRVLPLKAQLFDAKGAIITDAEIAAAPILQVLYGSGIGGDPVDVTDDAMPAGQGTEGNQFVFTDDLKWQFNLKTKNYAAPGTYSIFMVSGDDSEYRIDPTCEATFVIE